MGTMNKLTKIVLSFLMVITCINFSTVQAEDGEETNYSEPTTVETVSEDPANEVEQEVAQEEPAVEEEAPVEEAPAEQPAEEAAPVEEPQQEEVAPEASEEAQVEEANNAPEEAASEEATVAAEPQQEETTVAPEETQEEAKEEVQYPAFNATIEEQGVTLSASEGVFPQGTKVSATDKSDDDAVANALEATISAANGENLQATGFVAYDFSFVDANGNKVEPKGDVSVTYSNVSTTIPSSEVYRVYHVTDDGNVEAVEDSKVTVSDGQVTFTANSFSSYAVVGYNTIQPAVNAEGTENSDTNASEDNIALAANSYTVSFNINGGNGTTPSNVTAGKGKIITLPSGDAFRRSNYELVGWSENSNAIKTYENVGQYPIYPCGEKFEVTKNTKLYAVWAQNSGKFRAKLSVAVRTDGNTPGEPSINYDNVYKYYVEDLTESNILKYISPAKTVAGVDAVKTVLTDAFYQKITAKNAENKGSSTKPYYNPDTQYIEWYVVKYQNNDNTFHVDGTIKDKNVVTLSYEKNGATSGILPDSSTAYVQDNKVITVSQPGNLYNRRDPNSWQELKKSGYVFSGWNTAADGKGKAYQPGDTITLSENITLYAQWRAKEYTVKYDTKGGNTIDNATVNYNDVVALPTPTREDSEFSGWTYNGTPVKANSTYASIAGSENTTEIVLVAQWENTAGGEAGYFLSKQGATWNKAVDFINPWTDSANKALKYRINQYFHYGDTFIVTDAVPQVDNASFIGWLDKDRNDKGAAIKHAGDTVTYSYNKSNGKYSTYCLDALWAELKIEGVNEKYNGQPKTTSDAIIDINKGSALADEYKQQAERLIEEGDVYYSTDQKDWSTEKPSFKDAGTYTVYAKQDVTVGGVKTTLKASAQVVINPRTVTLTSANDSKPYDGTALTNDAVTVGGDGFVTGEGASYDVKGTITNAGETDNAFTYTLNSNTKAGNYTITKSEGKLKVTPVTSKVTVTVTGNTGSVTYDGSKHEVTGYNTSISNVLYTATDFSFSGKAEASRTDAGKTVMGLAAKQFKNVSKNFTNVEFVVTDGYSEVTKRNVTLTSASDSRVYNGKPLTNGKVTVSGDGFATGEGATYNVTGTITNAGETDNAFTYTLNDNTKAGNYEITPAYGKLTVTANSSEVVVTITENSSDSITYDGSEHVLTGYKVTSITGGTDYKAEDFTFNGNASVKGTDAGTYNMELTPSDFQNNNNNYSKVKFVIIDGTLTITKRNVTLTSASDSKTYDGNALTNDKVTVSGDGFATGEGATYNVTGTITNAGETDNAFTYTLNDNTKAGNYEITPAYGKLKVTPVTNKVTVTVTGNTGSVTYDGNNHEVTGYTTSISNVLYTATDFSFSGKAEASRTDAGKTVMGLKADQFSNTSKNFTNVEFAVTDGYSEVTKRNVTLTSASDSKTYDGNALTNHTVDAVGFVDGEGAAYDVTGTITDAGETDNTFTYTLNSNTKAGNYTITKVKGTLTVNPYDEAIIAKVSGAKATYVYDGTKYSVSGFTVEFEKPDGTPDLSKTNVVLKPGKKAKASGTAAGEYKMNLNASDFEWNDANFSNVTISIAEDGLLKITPASIDPELPNPTDPDNPSENTRFKVTGLTDVLYSGAEQKQTPTIKDTTTGKDLVKDTDYTITCSTEDFTNAGTITYTLSGIGNYSGTREVSYKIKQRVVNLKSDTASKTYDGTALTRPDVTVTGDGFVDGEAKATATGSVINVTATPVDNTIAIVPTEGSSYNANNYDIHKDEGKLSITAADITPTDPEKPETTRFTVEKPADTTYNGTSQQKKPVVKDGEKELVEDKDYTLTYPENTTDANANVEVTITGIGNYTGTRTTSYAINRKAVTLTSGSDSKTYDGQPLTAESVTPEGFVEGQGATYGEFATVTEVTPAEGADNTFNYTLNEGTNADNYEITQKFGKLIVNPVGTVTVTIVGNSDTVTYDGKEHTVKGYVVTNISDTLYSEADINFDGNDSVKRTEEGTSTMGITAENFSNTNTNFGTVNFVVTDGSLTITPASIDPTDPEKPTENTRFEVTGLKDVLYNGAEQKQTPTIKDTTTGKDLVKDTDYTITCSTEDFTNAGTITYTLSGIGNYSGTREVSYKIKQRVVNLKSDTASKTYDGTALTRPDVTVTGDGFVDGEAKATATGSVINVTATPVDNTIAIVPTEGSSYNANNYDIHKDEGKLSITAADITPTDPEKPETTRFTVEKPADTTYNGTSQQKKPVVKDGEKELVEDKDYTLTYPENTTDANANVEVTITGIGNYTGTRTTSYAINRKAVTLTSGSDSKTYDGQPLTAESVTPEGFVEGQGATYTGFATVTEVTETAVPNTFNYTLNEGTLESNYNITTNYGSLTITPKSITPDQPGTPEEKKNGIEVTKPEDSKYTGEEHKNAPTVTDTKTDKTLTEGTDYTLSYSDDVTNAGTVTVSITGKGNYTGEFNVTYEITKRDVVLTSATDSKKFDGTPLRNENVEVIGEGFAEGEGATYSEFAEVTNVTDEAVANTFTYALNENTLASNYNITTELGTLTITPKTITPDQPGTPDDKKTGITVENPGDVKYDGKDHAEKPVIKDEKTGVTLEEGKDYEIVYPEDIKNAGEITATVVGKGDYEGTFEIKFNILKRDVTFTSATDSKQYDGNALTNGNVEITGDGFIEGEGATFNVTGSITDVGSTNNAFTYAMNEGTNADNYNVTVVEGTLTVSEQPVVPTPATPTTPSNNTPARTNNVPARVVTNPTTTTPAPEATVEPEKAETTPAPTAKPEKIKEEATPQAVPKGHWALINLIAAMLSVVLAVVALLAKHAKDEDEDDEDKDDQIVANENEDDENESTRYRRWKVIATIDAILAVVVFILTENISLPMVLVDKWTVLMVLFGLISIVSTYFARKWHEEDEDEDEQSSQNA